MSNQVADLIIDLLKEVEDIDQKLEILRLAKTKLTKPIMTIDDIENRNYTYVRVWPKGNDSSETFLVSSPYREDALKLAQMYVDQKKWELTSIDVSKHVSKTFFLYPRNYIKKARRLFEEGKFI